MKDQFKNLLMAMACVAMAVPVVSAQQPFQNDPQQDDPVIIQPDNDRTPSRPFEVPGDLDPPQDQTVLLNSRYAGWQAAGIGQNGDRLSSDLRANWMMVDSNGRFYGQVIPTKGADLSNMTVYLMNMGRLVKQARVNPDGSYEFSNVRQGAYAIVGWGPKALFAYGLNILAYNQNAGGSTPTSLTTMAFQNHTSINTDWIQFFAPRVSFRVYGRYLTGEGQNDPAALYGFDGLVRYHPKAKPATSLSAHPVSRTADGRLLGRVHQMNSLSGRPVDVRTTRVMLLQNDEVYAATDADNFGVFEFKNVPNGEYGLVGVGVDGMGLIGINVVDAPMNADGQMTTDIIDFTMISSETVGWLNHYAHEVAYRRALLAPRRPYDDPNGQCENCGGNGCQTCGGTGLCRSRYQSFCDWAARCRSQHERTKLGSGFILSEFSKDLRRTVETSDNLFERAFYGDGGGGITGGGGYPGPGYGGGGGYGNGYGGGGGYPGNGGGY